MPTIDEELSTITAVDLKFELNLLFSNKPINQALMGYDLYGNNKVLKW